MKISYEQITDDVKVDSVTGEVLGEQRTTELKTIINRKIPDEPDYVKVYKYVNTLFAFKGIKQTLTPFIIEISNHMTYAKEGQIVNLNRTTKAMIANNLGVTEKRINQVITELKNYDILRKIQNGVYSVNPYIVARGSWADVRKLQTHYDFMTGEMTTIANVKDTISGQEIRKAITNSKNQVPGQISMFDSQQEEIVPPKKTNSNFNSYPQRNYDFDKLEKELLDN